MTIKVTNAGKRRLGLSGLPSVVLAPGESVNVTDEQYNSFIKNKTIVRWIDHGVVTVDGAPKAKAKAKVPPPVKAKPEIKTPAITESKPTAELVDSQPSLTVPDTEALPDGLTGEGIELYEHGNGWYSVYVHGFLVTDTKLRKEAAEAVMEEYK